MLPTLFDGRTTHAKAVLADLGPRYGVRVFTPISRSIRFAEAPAAGRSILATAGSSKGANDYRSWPAEVTEACPPSHRARAARPTRSASPPLVRRR